MKEARRPSLSSNPPPPHPSIPLPASAETEEGEGSVAESTVAVHFTVASGPAEAMAAGGPRQVQGAPREKTKKVDFKRWEMSSQSFIKGTQTCTHKERAFIVL